METVQWKEIETLFPEFKSPKCLILKGAELKGKSDLLQAIAKGFGFPGYFGHNWDALADCWSDLSWLESRRFLTVFQDADLFETKDKEAHDMTLEIAEEVAESWKGEAIFRLVRIAK